MNAAAKLAGGIPKYANGGVVKGKGSPTSDNVTAKLSPGEVVLPVDTVQALGGAAAVMKLISDTHTPSGQPSMKDGVQAKADGGMVEQDPARRMTAAPRQAGDSATSNQIPVGASRTVAPDGSQDSPLNNDFARNAMNTISALPGAAAIPGAVPAVATSLTSAAAKMAGPASAAGKLASAAAPYAVPGAGAVALGVASSPAAPAAVNPPQAAPATPVPPAAQRMTAVPVVQAPTAVAPAGLGNGAPTPQANDAASRMSGLSTAESLARVAETNASNPASPPLTLSQDPWSARKAMQNAETTASSIHKPTAQRGAAELAALRSDAQLAAREDAASSRAAMQDAGQTARAKMAETAASARFAQTNQLGRAELALKQTAASYQNRAADRLESAQSELLAATTPAAQKTAAEKLRALNGKEPANRFTVVPGGQEPDPATGLMRTLPARVINNETGSFVDQQPPAAKTSTSIAIGSKTTHPDGQFASGDKVVTIKNGIVTEVK